MEQNETINQEKNTLPINQTKKDYSIPLSILIATFFIVGAWIYTTGIKAVRTQQREVIAERDGGVKSTVSEEKVFPREGVLLPVRWNNLGAELIRTGVINLAQLKAVYEQQGKFTEEYNNLLLEENKNNQSLNLKITPENAGYLLNLFWALGLANKNPILDSGEMADPKYGGAQNFASTAGWTIAQGNPMNHYSNHKFLTLSTKQQMLVEKISKGIYRPCCNNSTHFPDCNHGMAMLGLLELMASQGVPEEDMWKIALKVNSYWFPDTYVTIATYMKNKGIEWENVSAQEILGINYSSASGYQRISAEVVVPQKQGGSGCGIDAGNAVIPKQQNGCGI